MIVKNINPAKVLFFLFILVAAPNYVMSQEPLFHHFSTDQGLSSLETYHVFQDSKGYLWISTSNGVTRFDGYTFQNFDEQDGLSDNIIFEAVEDYKGRIWFVGYNCKLSYYENGKIKPYQFNHAIEKLTPSLVLSVKSSFYIDRQNNVYLSLRYIGIIKISPNGNITRLDKLSENIADILQADNKVLVAQHHGTENMLNINTKYIHRTIVNNVLSKSKNLAVFAVVSSDHKSIFIACDHYLLKIFADGHYQIRTMESLILWISKDKDNMIWVCPFNDGAIALNENDILGPPVHNYLSDKSVSSVLQDKEGGFWFSTLDDGVFYLSSHKSFSYVYPSNLPDYEILHVETGDKEIFAGTGNCYLSVIKNNKITNYPVDTTTHSEITSLTYDRTHKELLIGTTYDPYVFKDGKISKLIDNYKKLNKKYEGILISARSIIKESKDTYWFGNIAGLSLVDINRHVVLSNSFRDHTVNNIRISSLYRFPDGSLLIGSTEGLWKYKQGQFIKINSSIPGLNKRILKIAGDSLGRNIWIATKGDGLYLKTIDGIHHFTRKEGLLNNSPTDLCLNRNDLWLTTSQGISCITIKKYKPLSYSLHNFNVDYGLASNQVYQIKTFGNKILVATNRGLSIID
ncbi:MAG: hypothetical protein Q8904_16485, partial [Bacteroidota bacterium]|nr:hypothetical protein [Bacteroidota bacterium]